MSAPPLGTATMKVLEKSRQGIYVQQGVSAEPVEIGDIMSVWEKKRGETRRFKVFHVDMVDNFYWWYGELYTEEAEDPCDDDFMEEISS